MRAAVSSKIAILTAASVKNRDPKTDNGSASHVLLSKIAEDDSKTSEDHLQVAENFQILSKGMRIYFCETQLRKPTFISG